MRKHLKKIKSTVTEKVPWDLFIFLLIIYGVVLVKLSTTYYFRHDPFFTFYSVLVGVYILSRFLLAYFHKDIPYNENYEPTVSFVVPAYNEEDNIAETIRRFTEVNYPKNKIEVITVNDGSRDNTYAEMLKIKDEAKLLGVSVEVVNWEVNKGKREGMAEGIRRAKNEIIIFIDSDSFIDKECVKHLVKYFSSEKIGAVSGHTEVFNVNDNLLTQMQSLRYYVAFKIYKAAESIFGNVTCCPGCCSAYRKSYLEPILDQWLNQKFLGTTCTFGDDRSLTNFIIRKYHAVYCVDAIAYTVAPNTFRQYTKQQQRWKKSWVRESFIAASFMWKKNIIASISFYTCVFLTLAAPVVLIKTLFISPIFLSHVLPWAYLVGLIMMLMLHGAYYRYKNKNSAWFLPVLTLWFYTIMLMWQLPWAIITVRDTRWGTR